MRKEFEIKKIKQILSSYFDKVDDLSVEKAEEGVSTNVFKITDTHDTYYLRIAGYKNECFDPEVIAHKEMLQKGATVPKILYYENFNKTIGHSFMIINEINGFPASKINDKNVLQNILVEAGKDIARCNSVKVHGYGHIQKSKKSFRKLIGNFKNYKSNYNWVIDENLEFLLEKGIINQNLFNDLKAVIRDYDSYLESPQSHLMHYDFDLTHIYTDGEKYSGIIDFGDITGSCLYTDLAHYAIYSGKGLENLVEGYNQITKLHSDWRERVFFAGIPIASYKLYWVIKNIPQKNTGTEIEFLKQALEELT